MGIDTVRLVFSLLYALTHSARNRSLAWRGQQAQPCLSFRFLCFDALGEKPKSGLAKTAGPVRFVLCFVYLVAQNTPALTRRLDIEALYRIAPMCRKTRRRPFRKNGARLPHDENVV